MNLKDEVLKLRNKGLSYEQISQKMDITRNSVAGFLYRHRVANGLVPSVPAMGSKTRKAFLLHKSGFSYSEIAEKLNTTTNAAKVMTCRARRAYGVPIKFQRDRNTAKKLTQKKLIGYAGQSDSGTFVSIGSAAARVVEGLR